jgi:hypothetical protein
LFAQGANVYVCDTLVPVPVAGLLKVMVVPAIAVMVVPGGMFGPVTPLPTARPTALATVAVVLPKVVVVFTLPVMFGGTVAGAHDPTPTAVCPAGVVKFVLHGGCARASCVVRRPKAASRKCA